MNSNVSSKQVTLVQLFDSLKQEYGNLKQSIENSGIANTAENVGASTKTNWDQFEAQLTEFETALKAQFGSSSMEDKLSSLKASEIDSIMTEIDSESKSNEILAKSRQTPKKTEKGSEEAERLQQFQEFPKQIRKEIVAAVEW